MRRTPRGGWPWPVTMMHFSRCQNLSSLKRFQTASFSMSRTYLASHFSNWMTSVLDDGGDRPAARAHAPQVDGVAGVDGR